ncbi:phosphopentomutase/2,3-bisphosphoglycerate-independent phosphoglycerate mutase family metalloenzyme [Flavobacterium sp. 270]|uniref:phosphoglyceromutase n=1 Tax=Flavobacterium sp. 270 TaxID=2512114 RepID=UPI00106503C0|nr:phosphoglyceromutase [Flavobacterium sp. 270]TDW52592.1 phosphopentomutase/2,3-bisphosphoglycerate-independent phosphoglycerate mutase family metalloenzyme [Flavobacterium sp. 270]
MKKAILILFILLCWKSQAQKTENIIIITTDGLRWQEVFKGVDTAIANDKKFNQGDSTYIYKKYYSAKSEESRKKIMPFLWSEIVAKGQIYGNREYGNKVDVSNPYWFSYPGYSEIMTGNVDLQVNSNAYKANPNVNVLEFLNQQPKLKGKTAAFGAWDAFDRILNEERSGFPVISAFDKVGGNRPTAVEKLLNEMRDNSFKPFHEDECLDVFTHYEALNELKTKKPKVLYISYGETDEWAHAGHYRSYLDAQNQVDNWIKEIWNFVQNDPQYKNKTTLFITVDHGRGDKTKTQWTDHGADVVGASQIWFAAIGPEIVAKGEMKNESQLYQKQFAQTFAKIMGYTFTASHPVAEEIPGLQK